MCGIVIKFQSTYKLVVQVFGYLAMYVLIEQKKLANDKQLRTYYISKVYQDKGLFFI